MVFVAQKSVLKTSENIWTLELLLFTGSEVHTSSVMAPGSAGFFVQDPPVEDGAPVGLSN